MSDDFLHIAVAVIRDESGRILISERKADCAYAGQWEFPGGKVESGENVQQALRREIDEELGLSVLEARPLIHIRYEYPDRQVMLDTWEVTAWSGVAQSCEGQRFQWVVPSELDDYRMLAANRPIVRAVQLPDEYLITPDCGDSVELFLQQFEQNLKAGLRLLRLRQPHMNKSDYLGLAQQCGTLCREYHAVLMVDEPQVAQQLRMGLHLSAAALRNLDHRPLSVDCLVGASCHDIEELALAEKLGCDFAVLGAVKATPSHPDIEPMGWAHFEQCLASSSLPVYALGGMKRDCKQRVWASGGQGIAAIRGLWPA